VIRILANGGGQTDPAGTDGLLETDPLPTLKLPVTVTIGGIAAEVHSAGGSAGQVAGMLEIQVVVPPDTAPADAVPVAVQIGDATSQDGVTIAVRAP
jgi:uncharacterized protein (TIGR03437 family)